MDGDGGHDHRELRGKLLTRDARVRALRVFSKYSSLTLSIVTFSTLDISTLSISTLTNNILTLNTLTLNTLTSNTPTLITPYSLYSFLSSPYKEIYKESFPLLSSPTSRSPRFSRFARDIR